MKYYELIQISKYLNNFSNIVLVKRVDDRNIKILFDKENVFFDLSKIKSEIYITNDFLETKDYTAPFDISLNKFFSKSKLLETKVLKNNRILQIKVLKNYTYKQEKFILQLEFTGKNTNAIILNEQNIILDALRHIDEFTSYRVVKINHELKKLDEIQINEKKEEILDIKEHLIQKYINLNIKELNNLKTQKLKENDKKIKSLHDKLNKLKPKEELLKNAQNLNQKASLLLANLHLLNNYQKEVILKDFDDNEVKISLLQTPKKEINSLFNASKKLKQKAKLQHLEKQNLEYKINFLLGLQNLIKTAKTKSEINILMPKKIKQNKKTQDLNICNFYFKNFKIIVGKNQQANEKVLKLAKKDDFWFHLKDIASSHVLIVTNKMQIPDDVIEFAAKLCVSFSVKQSGNYEVDFTKRLNVKIIDKSYVNYVNYNTINIKFEKI